MSRFADGVAGAALDTCDGERVDQHQSGANARQDGQQARVVNDEPGAPRAGDASEPEGHQNGQDRHRGQPIEDGGAETLAWRRWNQRERA
jgi:hypothetical protein